MPTGYRSNARVIPFPGHRARVPERSRMLAEFTRHIMEVQDLIPHEGWAFFEVAIPLAQVMEWSSDAVEVYNEGRQEAALRVMDLIADELLDARRAITARLQQRPRTIEYGLARTLHDPFQDLVVAFYDFSDSLE